MATRPPRGVNMLGKAKSAPRALLIAIAMPQRGAAVRTCCRSRQRLPGGVAGRPQQRPPGGAADQAAAAPLTAPPEAPLAFAMVATPRGVPSAL